MLNLAYLEWEYRWSATGRVWQCSGVAFQKTWCLRVAQPLLEYCCHYTLTQHSRTFLQIAPVLLIFVKNLESRAPVLYIPLLIISGFGEIAVWSTSIQLIHSTWFVERISLCRPPRLSLVFVILGQCWTGVWVCLKLWNWLSGFFMTFSSLLM